MAADPKKEKVRMELKIAIPSRLKIEIQAGFKNRWCG